MLYVLLSIALMSGANGLVLFSFLRLFCWRLAIRNPLDFRQKVFSRRDVLFPFLHLYLFSALAIFSPVLYTVGLSAIRLELAMFLAESAALSAFRMSSAAVCVHLLKEIRSRSSSSSMNSFFMPLLIYFRKNV